MNRYFLITSKYEEEKSRVILYFSKNPLSKNYEYIYRKKYNPYYVLKSNIEVIKNLLNDFKKEINIKKLEDNKIKIIAKNYTTLQKTYNILRNSINEEILLIEPTRQFLIEKDWSYYDSFYLFYNRNIKKVEGEDLIHNVVKKYLENIDYDLQSKLIEPITKKLLISNILKIKPYQNIANDQILNLLFENYFFKENLLLKKNNKIEYTNSITNTINTIKLDFSNIWPYLLQSKFNNIGYKTLNCTCCKPDSIYKDNIANNSLVKVEFLKHGFYFISKDSSWAYDYHKNNKYKKNRINYKKNNRLRQIPIGPFFKNQTEYILLSDAIRLLEEGVIKIIDEDLSKIKWCCKKQNSFISLIVENLIKKLQNIEQSINITTRIFYSKKLETNNLERNPQFIQYLTEYSLIYNLLNEIPKFLQHKNTKFYNKEIDLAIKSIKLKTFNSIDNNKCRYIQNKEILQTRDKELVNKINIYFPKLDLPIPKIIN
jgi:hypothetical protein